MFCTNCGQKLGDGHRFCANCGTAVTDGAHSASPPSLPAQNVDPSVDWRNSMNVGEIINHPDVRARVVQVTGATPQGMTAEQFFKYAERIINSKMASSVWSWEGNMIITLESREEGTLLKGTITVPGQAFDWGRSKRVLQNLIDDVQRYRV